MLQDRTYSIHYDFIELKVFGVWFPTVMNWHALGKFTSCLVLEPRDINGGYTRRKGKALGSVSCVYFSCRTLNSCFGPITVLETQSCLRNPRVAAVHFHELMSSQPQLYLFHFTRAGEHPCHSSPALGLCFNDKAAKVRRLITSLSGLLYNRCFGHYVKAIRRPFLACLFMLIS